MAPVSLEVSVKVALVAPPMSMQLPPAESQRRHWYEYANGAVPLQVPDDPANPKPTMALPLIDGAEVFAGGDPVGGVVVPPLPAMSVGRGAMTLVSAEALEAVPNLLVAVTRTLSRYVTSTAASA